MFGLLGKKVTIGAVGWKPREEDGRFSLCFYKRVPRRVHRGVTQTAASDGRARSGITHLCTASSRRWFMGAGCLKPRVTLMASDAEHLFLCLWVRLGLIFRHSVWCLLKFPSFSCGRAKPRRLLFPQSPWLCCPSPASSTPGFGYMLILDREAKLLLRSF